MSCHFSESFGQAFSKACAVEAAEASSLSAESETPLTAFSFASFSLAPPSCKRKAAKEFATSNELSFGESFGQGNLLIRHSQARATFPAGEGLESCHICGGRASNELSF